MSTTLWILLLAAVAAELAVTRTTWARRLRRLLPWYSGAGRALVALVAVGVGPESNAVVILVGVAAISRLITSYLMGVVQPAMRQSLAAVGVADEYFEAFRLADVTSRRFPATVGVMSLAQILIDVVVAIAGVGGTVPAALAIGLAILAVIELANHTVAVGQWNRRHELALKAMAADLELMRPRIVLYTAALPTSAVNLEHWLPSIESTDEVVYIVSRELATLEHLATMTALPIVYVKALGGLEELIPDSVELALYVDTSVRNNHLLRIAGLTHVQLHHGESDKASSSSRLLRLYDHHLVAGVAAVDRLRDNDIIRTQSQATIVGRPIAAGLERRPVSRVEPIVLYAPTWEGYHRDNAVSSLALGPDIVTKLLADVRIRTVVRAHPLTGEVDPAMTAFVSQMARLVSGRPSAEMSAEPSAAAAIRALDRADVLITDVSSMLGDFLYTGRPVVVVDSAGLGDVEFVRRYPAVAAAYIVRSDLSNLGEMLAAALGDDPLREQRLAVGRRVLGDAGDGAVRDLGAALGTLGG